MIQLITNSVMYIVWGYIFNPFLPPFHLSQDGEPIQIDNKHYRETQDGAKYNLQLWNTTAEDKGVYECVAENKCGRTRSHCTIRMVEPVEDKPTDPKPVLKSNPEDVKVREGEKITLTAVFEDLPGTGTLRRVDGGVNSQR